MSLLDLEHTSVSFSCLCHPALDTQKLQTINDAKPSLVLMNFTLGLKLKQVLHLFH